MKRYCKLIMAGLALIYCSGLRCVPFFSRLPQSVRSQASSLLYNTARSYQFTVAAQLVAQGDMQAYQACQDLLATYTPTDLICIVGADHLYQFAQTISGTVASSIPAEVTANAVYQALQAGTFKLLSLIPSLSQPVGNQPVLG